MRIRFTITLTMAAVLLATVLPSRALADDWEIASHQVYPNPFTEGTTFQLTLPKSANIRISVYDMVGRLTRTLFEGVHEQTTGSENVYWDGKDLTGNPVPAGVYICVLYADNVAVKSVKVVKINP